MKRTDLWIDRALIALWLAIVFARGLFTPLQVSWDDGRFIVHNARVLSITWSAFVANISEIQFEAFHPLHMLSYWLDVPWFGPDPFAIHVTNLLLWIVASFCVLQALRELGLSRTSALIATALCMAHPAQVEAVTWATGRKDVLALLFSALAITWHLRSSRFNDRAAWISRAMFLLAALSKTSVATLPLFLLLIDGALQRRSVRKALLQQLPSMCLMLALGVLTLLTWQGSHMLAVRGEHEPGVLSRWAATVSHQLLTAVWPSRNAPMYATHAWAEPSALMLLGPLVVLIGSGLLWRARLRIAAVGLLGFTLLLLPASNLLPMVFPLQDRYLSLPLLALALCVGSVVQESRRLGSILAIVCVLALGLRTVQYQGAWQSELALWEHATATQPRAYYAWMKLGEVRRDGGDLSGAAAAYRTMVSKVPAVELGHVALFHALVLLDEKQNRLPPTPPMDLARRFRIGMRDASQLHQLSQELIGRGYDEAAAMALDYALTLQPFPESVLATNAERFEREQRRQLTAVLRRHAKHAAANQ